MSHTPASTPPAGATGTTAGAETTAQGTVAPAAAADTLELLGLVAHIESNSFVRTAASAVAVPEPDQRLELSRAAALAVGRQDAVLARMGELGLDAQQSAETMFGFDATFEDYNARTEPSDLWEAILKEYVGHGVADDFCRIVSGGLDEQTRQVVTTVLDEDRTSDSAIEMLEDATNADQVLSSRLALWGRRLVGEALSVIQQLLAQHAALARLADQAFEHAFAANPQAAPVERNAWLFSRLTAEHARRMGRLGLAA